MENCTRAKMVKVRANKKQGVDSEKTRTTLKCEG